MINYVSDKYVKTYITIKNGKFEVMAFCSLCTLSLGAVGQLMTALALIQLTVSNFKSWPFVFSVLWVQLEVS